MSFQVTECDGGWKRISSEGAEVWLMDATDNPSGSHYHYVYERLFEDYIRDGKIVPGRTKLLEISTGSAGISFAHYCQIHGNPGAVVVPRSIPENRVRLIEKFGCQVIRAKYDNYLVGARQHLIEMLKAQRDRPADERYFFLNHSENWASVEALALIGQRAEAEQGEFEAFVGAVGNGASLLGVARGLGEETAIFGCDPEEAPVGSYYFTTSERVRSLLDFHDHDVYGTGAWGVPFRFLQSEEFRQRITEVQVVTRVQRVSVSKIVYPFAHSTELSVAAACALARKMKLKKILCLGYDKIDRY